MAGDTGTVTPYSLLFSGDYGPTLGAISEGLKAAPEIDLIFGVGITVALGHAFLAAFGEEDMRPKGLFGLVLPAFGTELERRGHDAMSLNFNMVFKDWCNAMSSGSPSLYAVPVEWWTSTQLILADALSRLEDGPDTEEARESLHMANNAIQTMLRQHGQTATLDQAGSFQA